MIFSFPRSAVQGIDDTVATPPRAPFGPSGNSTANQHTQIMGIILVLIFGGLPGVLRTLPTFARKNITMSCSLLSWIRPPTEFHQPKLTSRPVPPQAPHAFIRIEAATLAGPRRLSHQESSKPTLSPQ